jgi:acetyl-CoA carboxylase biotin carboxyl carrier protein
MEMSQEVMKALIDAFDRSDWQEMTVTIGSDRLHISRRAGTDVSAPATTPASVSVSVDGAGSDAAGASAPAPARAGASARAPAPAGASAAPAKPEESAHGDDPPQVQLDGLPRGAVIESPSVGLFWRAPSPGAPPFIETGQAVSEGDTLAIVEVMKLMNHLVAPVDGIVAAILPKDGESVEHGQPLVVIDPGG